MHDDSKTLRQRAQRRQRALVVLGCPVLEGGRLGAAAVRRTERALAAFHEWTRDPAEPLPLVVVSGGRRWHGEVEAIAIGRQLTRLGVPAGALVLELCSLSTLENAAYSAELLRARSILDPAIVTCDWHMPRALACFGWMGLSPTGLPAASPRRVTPVRVARTVRERMRRLFDRRAASAWSDP